MSVDPITVRITDGARSSLGAVRTLVVPTDLGGHSCTAAARAAAAAAAAGDRDLLIVLHERSDETWADTPRPTGPLRAHEVGDDRLSLKRCLAELAGRAVDAVAWISTVPTITDVVTAVEQLGADGVLLAADQCDRTLVDRLTGAAPASDHVEGAIEPSVARPVVVFSLDADATIDVAAVTTDAAAPTS